MVDDYFFVVPVSLFFRECWFLQLLQKQCVAFALITFSYELLLYANYAVGYRSRHPDRRHRLLIIVNATACWHTVTRLETSTLISSDICWWVYGQPIQLCWPYLSVSSCCWKFSDLLHPRHRMIRVGKVDPGLISKHHTRPVLMVTVLVSVPTCVASGDDMQSVWGVCLYVLSNIQPRLKGSADHDTASNLP